MKLISFREELSSSHSHGPCDKGIRVQGSGFRV